MDISRSEFLTKKCERRSTKVTVGEDDYYLRSLTAREWTDCQALLRFGDGQDAYWEFKTAVLVAVLTDAAGNQLLLPEDAEALDAMPPLLIETLFDRAQTFLEEDVVTDEEAKKN